MILTPGVFRQDLIGGLTLRSTTHSILRHNSEQILISFHKIRHFVRRFFNGVFVDAEPAYDVSVGALDVIANHRRAAILFRLSP